MRSGRSGGLTWRLVRDAPDPLSGPGAAAAVTAVLGLTSVRYAVTPGREQRDRDPSPRH